MAIVSAFLAGLAMFSDLGLAPSIVQGSRGDDPRFLDTAWTLQIARGVGLFAFSCLLASPLAAFYGQPLILGLLPAAGFGVLIAGFNSTSLPRLQRHLAVAKLTLVELSAQISGVAVTLGWALIHPTVWALVGGGLASASVTLALSRTVAADRRDRLAWHRDSARDLFHFGKWIFVSTVLAFLVGQSDRLIFGKLTSVATLGVYSIASMFAMLPSGVVHRVGIAVVFPAFSRKTESMTGFESAFRRSRRPLLAFGGLIVACLGASGPPLIEVLYDPRYAEAGWILQLLAIEGWFQILEVPYGSALLALGLPRWLAVANALKLAGILALVPLGFWLYGFPGAIGGFAVSETLRYAVCAAGAPTGFPARDRPLCVGAGRDRRGVWLYASFAIGRREERVRAPGRRGSGRRPAWLPVSYLLVRKEAARLAADLGIRFR
jgi:O-antigen/teichoic acid export membrane protein